MLSSCRSLSYDFMSCLVAADQIAVAGQLQVLHYTDEAQIGRNSHLQVQNREVMATLKALSFVLSPYIVQSYLYSIP